MGENQVSNEKLTAKVDLETEQEAKNMAAESDKALEDLGKVDSKKEKNTKPQKKKTVRKKQTTNDYIRMLKFYYLPIFIILIFLLIALLAVYPTIKSVLSNYSDLNQLKTDSSVKDERLVKLKSLKANSSKTEEYLTSINKIAPIEKTSVTDFQNAIKTIARANSLEVESASGGEEIVADQDSSKSFQLVEVPMLFVLTGNFADMKNFLTDIYQGDNFIIIEKMDLSRSTKTSQWEMDLTLVKYQFVQNENTSADGTTPSAQTLPLNLTPNQNVLKFLDEKYLATETIETTEGTTEETTDTAE